MIFLFWLTFLTFLKGRRSKSCASFSIVVNLKFKFYFQNLYCVQNNLNSTDTNIFSFPGWCAVLINRKMFKPNSRKRKIKSKVLIYTKCIYTLYRYIWLMALVWKKHLMEISTIPRVLVGKNKIYNKFKKHSSAYYIFL